MIENFRMSADEETQKADEESLEIFSREHRKLGELPIPFWWHCFKCQWTKKLSKYLSLNKNLEMHSWLVTSGLSCRTFLNTS